jgi:hypothetical protein
MTASASSLPDLDKSGSATVDISKFTMKGLNKRSSPSGAEYKCELEPLWLAANLVEKLRPELRERTSDPHYLVAGPGLGV